MRDEAAEQLRIVELATDSDDVAEGPFGAGEGAVGAVASRGLMMNLENLKPGYKGLCYYRGGALVRCFLGVPVVENGQVLGALCADRVERPPLHRAAKRRCWARPSRRCCAPSRTSACSCSSSAASASRRISTARRRRSASALTEDAGHRRRPRRGAATSRPTTSRRSRSTTPTPARTACARRSARAPSASRRSPSATTRR